MADNTETASIPTNFAEFEAGGGKYNAQPASKSAKSAPGETESTSSEATRFSADAETVADPETADTATKPVPEERDAPKKPPVKTTENQRPKLTLANEHAKLLKDVTELRRERRELQQLPPSQPAPQAGTATTPATTPAATEDKPPVRPKLSTFDGTLDQFEAAVDKYEEEQRKWFDRQLEKRDSERQMQAEAQKVRETYGAKLADHLKEHPEYDAEIGQTPLSPLMVDIVLHEGPGLGQQLIDNKDEARRIAALPRDVQIFEMGKLAALAQSNGNGASAHAETTEEPVEEETPLPVKIPAKLGTSNDGTGAAVKKPGHGAKNYAEFEAIERRLAQKRK